jgi:Xaa-Pro dipeptidase
MKAKAAGIPDNRIFGWTDEEGYTGAFQQACAHLELTDYLLAVEALHMRVLELELLKRYAPGLQTSHAEPILMVLRAVKEAEEITALERAIEVAQRAMQRLLPKIKIGMTEKQVAALLTQYQLDEGAEAIAFGPIVSTGPNAASPHALPSSRPLQEGDLLVIDWGCIVDGYPSDITRTFAVGNIDAESRKIYDTVKLSNEQGVLASAPGATGEDIDNAARDVIEDMGYGSYFIHRTGHGLGIEGHEPPFMMQGNLEALIPGNVFTVEPGIYIPDRLGVRIEDDIVITEDGFRCLTTFPRELITVG